MDFKAWLENTQAQINEWVENSKEYFSSLNQNEKYGWIGESTGFVLLLAGIVLLVL